MTPTDTRLFAVRVYPNGLCSIVMGRAKLEVMRNIADTIQADAKCNELNEQSEEWRIERKTK